MFVDFMVAVVELESISACLCDCDRTAEPESPRSPDMPSTANAMNVMLSGAQNTDDDSELSVSAELVWSTAPSTATAT